MRNAGAARLSELVKKREFLVGICAALAGSLVVAFLSFDRSFFTFSTETDYIARNLREAERLRNGEAMLLQFHPPLYSIVLAFVQFLFRDWFTTGLFVSWISSSVVLAASFAFFHRLFGRAAAFVPGSTRGSPAGVGVRRSA